MKLKSVILHAATATAGTLRPRQSQNGSTAPKGAVGKASVYPGLNTGNPFTAFGNLPLEPFGLDPSNVDPANLDSWLSESIGSMDQFFRDITKPAMIANTTLLTPRVRSNATRKQVRFGPYSLIAAGTPKDTINPLDFIGLDPNGQSFLLNVTGKDGFCSDCTILSGQVSLTFENGTKAQISNGIYLHHVLTRDVSKYVRDFISTCPINETVAKPGKPSLGLNFPYNAGAEFIGVGNDNSNAPILWTAPEIQLLSGYHVQPDDEFSIIAEVVNYLEEPVEIFITYDVEYLPIIQGRNTQQTLLSVTGCDDTEPFTSPSGPVNTTSNRFLFYEDGDIIDAKGHLHDGGVRMYMFINDRFVCSSDARYVKPEGTVSINGTLRETITEMTHCKGPIPVKKGDWLTMTSEYDLSKHSLRSMTLGADAEAMGKWSLVFAPKEAQ